MCNATGFAALYLTDPARLSREEREWQARIACEKQDQKNVRRMVFGK